MFGWFKKKPDGLRIAGEVRALRLGPTDKVVLSLDFPVGDKHVERLRKLAEEIFPDNTVVVMPKGARLEVVKEVAPC